MSLLEHVTGGPPLRLNRDLIRTIKRGNPWVFADALRDRPEAPAGAHVALKSRDGKVLGRGFYDPHSTLAFRMCMLGPRACVDEGWARSRFDSALALRDAAVDRSQTTAYRLVNGEGDGMPGLVVDVYGAVGVVVLDGPAATAFWSADGIARYLQERLGLRSVYLRQRLRGGPQGSALLGAEPIEPVAFKENGLHFVADVRKGQKTGFFIDQRDNRQRVRGVAKGRTVLNVCGYTGGFSVYAFAGGATSVTTVDRAKPALAMAADNWAANGFPSSEHEVVEADMFAFTEQARRGGRRWQLVILDPPSFAPNKKAVTAAENAYVRLIAAGAHVTETNGLLVAASCSSHVSPERFVELCRDGVGKARARGTLVGVYGQPMDHPAPLALEAFRYLKFVVMRLDR